MVIEILANAGQISLDLDAVRAEMRRRSHTGEHQ